MRHIVRITAAAAAMASLLMLGSARAADQSFVDKAAMSGMAEVAAGEMAKDKGNSDAVKRFGEKMVNDHTKANEELKAIATRKGMKLPADPGREHKQALAKLEAKSGQAFDKAYKSQMVKDHQKAVSLFEQQAKSGQDADLKAFADKTLPTLKDHLAMAKAMK